MPQRRSRCMASTAMPAVFFSPPAEGPGPCRGSRESDTPGASTAHRAHAIAERSDACGPRMSKPTATLPTLAGANAVADARPVAFTTSLPGTRTRAAGPAKHAAGGDGRARAGSLHDERVAVVARRLESHDVVGQRDVGERMRCVGSSTTPTVAVPAAASSRADVARARGPARARLSGASSIGASNSPRRSRNSSTPCHPERLRHQAFDRDVAQLEPATPSRAPRMISLRATSMPGQVVARIGLRVTLRLGCRTTTAENGWRPSQTLKR